MHLITVYLNSKQN